MRLFYGLAAAAIMFAVMTLTQPAHAAIDLGEVYGSFKPYVEAAVNAAIVGLFGVVLELVRRKLNLSIDDSSRAALQAALTNGAGLALNKLGNRLHGQTITTTNPAVDAALLYVLAAAPKAITRFGLTPEQIREKILAKLPQVANTTSVV